MQRMRLKPILWSLAALVACGLGIYALWSYIFSFQTVTFHYDTSVGSVQLVNSSGEELHPPAHQPVELKKGTYQLVSTGDNITARTQQLTVDSTTDEVEVTFHYTSDRLDTLYAQEATVIEAVIAKRYPKLSSLYDMTHAELYGTGDIFGATLVARDEGDNSDTLRILLEKREGVWIVISKPPVPVLTVVDFPDIDRDILLDINQVK